MNHGYINQTVTATYQTQTYRFTHRDTTCKTLITRMKANVGVLLTVALVYLSHASGFDQGRRKKASDVIRLLGNVKQPQYNMQTHNILKKNCFQTENVSTEECRYSVI